MEPLGKIYAACKNWKTRRCPAFLNEAMSSTYPCAGDPSEGAQIREKKPSSFLILSRVKEICMACDKFILYRF